MATIAKPTGYLRSAENTKDADAQAAHEARRLAKLDASRPQGFEWEDDCREREALSFGVSGARSGGLVVRSSITDESRYDLEGRVYP